jgi:hypothetical protein
MCRVAKNGSVGLMQLSEHGLHMLGLILELVTLLVKQVVSGRGIEDPRLQGKEQKSRGEVDHQKADETAFLTA